MKPLLQNRVLETVGRHDMIQPGDRVGLGVSGGADSVAMLHLFSGLKDKLGIGIFVLHFHHQLRGAEADEDERFVERMASKFGVEFVSDRADVADEARREGLNLEDTARRLRYQFFGSVATSLGLNCVAVGHTADDQAETVLAHLLRGTGMAGLAGIYPVAGLTIRPLIDIGRQELRDYLVRLGQCWREDTSNADTSRMRSRIRHQLLPLLKRDFEPSVVVRLARLANHAREDVAGWRLLEESQFTALVSGRPDGSISIAIADLLSPLPLTAPPGESRKSLSRRPPDSTLSMTRHLVRRMIAEVRGSRRQLTARHVQNVLDLATNSHSGARVELPGIVVQRDFDQLIFSSNSADLDSRPHAGNVFAKREFEYVIESPSASELSCIVVPEIGRRFSLKKIDWPAAESETTLARGTLDFDRLRWPLILRNWRPGDAFRPCGRKRIRKLKHLFLESRIPRRTRESWPVLASAGKVIWASGYCVAEGFSAREGTRAGLMIAEEDFQVQKIADEGIQLEINE